MVKKALSAGAWSRLLREQAASGLTVREFCDRRSIAASTLFAWKRKLAVAGGMPSSSTSARVVRRRTQNTADANGSKKKRRPRRAAAFVEAKMFVADTRAEREHAGMIVTIELACGRRVRIGEGFNRQLLLDVIDALESHARGDGEYKKLEHKKLEMVP